MIIKNPMRCLVSKNCNRIALLAALTAAIAGASFTTCAAGSPEDEAFQKKLFGRAPAGKQTIHTCFSRVYDPGHLAQHPQQNVRTMLLLVKGSSGSEGLSYGVRIGVTFRKSGVHFETAGDCNAIHDDTDAGDRQRRPLRGGLRRRQHGCRDQGCKIGPGLDPDGARIWRPGNDEDEPEIRASVSAATTRSSVSTRWR